MKAVDAATMRAIDKGAVKRFGMLSIQLMENGGRGVAGIVLAELAAMSGFSCRSDKTRASRVSIMAGKGNNGGDGFVVARHLKNAGVDVTLYLLSEFEALKGDARINAVVWQRMGGLIKTVRTRSEVKKYESSIRHSKLIVDALLGTGLSEPVRGLYATVIELVNSIGKRVVAIDVPSGIDASNGKVPGVAVKADVTATMAAPKIGLFTYPAREYAGRIDVVDIGLPVELLNSAELRWNVTRRADVKRVLVPRKIDSHKGSFGHLLLVAGSLGKSGAAFLASTAAMRMGVGLATLALPEGLCSVMEVKSTEVMTLALPESKDGSLSVESYDIIAKEITGGAASKNALVIGPGLGTSSDIKELVKLLVKGAKIPLVIDADGLNVLGKQCGGLKEAKAGLVITPHPGEAARLLGVSVTTVQADRIRAAERLVKLTGAVVVLKGACSIIAAPGGEIYFNTTGNAGLATAGTGDVLTGMIGAQLAGGKSPLDSALSSVYLHGRAADRIKERVGENGMMAMDIIDELPAVLNSFRLDSWADD